MNRYAIDECLKQLADDGQWLVNGRDRERGLTWFARSVGTLSVVLPANSELRSQLEQLYQAHLSQTLPQVPQQAVDLLRLAFEMNRLRRDDSVVADLRQDVQTVIAETFVNSWWFRLPILILVATIAFALAGVIQINNINVDVRQRAADAARKAEEDIAGQRDRTQKVIAQIGEDARMSVERQIKLELQDNVADARTGINDAAKVQIDELKRQKVPQLDIMFGATKASVDRLQRDATGAEKRIGNLHLRADELARAINQMKTVGTNMTLLDRLGAYLHRSRTYIVVESVAVGISLLFSIWALISVTRNR